MSSVKYEFKLGIGIKQLLNEDLEKQAEFLKPIFGNDLEIDEFNGKIDYISMDTDNWQYRYNLLFYVLDKADTELYSSISLEDITKYVRKIEKKLGINLKNENIKLFSASWYNGVDEPCYNDSIKWKEELDTPISEEDVFKYVIENEKSF